MLTYTASHDCGWTGGAYRYEAQAAYALRRHSCEKAQARAAARARGQARMDAVDRAPKPCPHKAGHEHGTYVAYVMDLCRCKPCVDAAAAYERQRIRRNAYGRSDLIDAEPARTHVHDLMAAGVGLKQITHLTGISGGVLAKLVYGTPTRPPARRVRKATAAKLLALRPSLAVTAAGAKVNSVGTARRTQALVALGWTVPQICEHAGLDRQRVDRALRGGDVLADTAKRIAATYDALWDRTPPEGDRWHQAATARARSRARAAGWVPPMAWDDDTIDDPTAAPDLGATVTPRGPGRPRLRSGEAIVEDIEWLLEQDAALTAEQAAHRLRMRPDTLQQALRRAERNDLLSRLNDNRGRAA